MDELKLVLKILVFLDLDISTNASTVDKSLTTSLFRTLQEYENEVGLANGNANNNGAIEARLHLLEVSNAVTQEVFND